VSVPSKRTLEKEEGKMNVPIWEFRLQKRRLKGSKDIFEETERRMIISDLKASFES